MGHSYCRARLASSQALSFGINMAEFNREVMLVLSGALAGAMGMFVLSLLVVGITGCH
jgi:hypothetical protein